MARAVGVLSPVTTKVFTEEELLSQLAKTGFPAVLKTDGSSGGSGVAIVSNETEAIRAFRNLADPPGIVRAFKRLILDEDANLILPCLRRDRGRVSVQPFVYGKNCNVAVACWEGENPRSGLRGGTGIKRRNRVIDSC